MLSQKKKKEFWWTVPKKEKNQSLGDMHIRVVFSGAEIATDIYFLYHVILKCLHFFIISMYYYYNQKIKSKSRVERITTKKIFDYVKGETTY